VSLFIEKHFHNFFQNSSVSAHANCNQTVFIVTKLQCTLYLHENRTCLHPQMKNCVKMTSLDENKKSELMLMRHVPASI